MKEDRIDLFLEDTSALLGETARTPTAIGLLQYLKQLPALQNRPEETQDVNNEEEPAQSCKLRGMEGTAIFIDDFFATEQRDLDNIRHRAMQGGGLSEAAKECLRRMGQADAGLDKQLPDIFAVRRDYYALVVSDLSDSMKSVTETLHSQEGCMECWKPQYIPAAKQKEGNTRARFYVGHRPAASKYGEALRTILSHRIRYHIECAIHALYQWNDYVAWTHNVGHPRESFVANPNFEKELHTAISFIYSKVPDENRRLV